MNDIRQQPDTIAGEPSDWADAYNPLAGYERLQRRHAAACAQRRAGQEETEALSPKLEPVREPEATLTCEQVASQIDAALRHLRRPIGWALGMLRKQLREEITAQVEKLRAEIDGLRSDVEVLRAKFPTYATTWCARQRSPGVKLR